MQAPKSLENASSAGFYEISTERLYSDLTLFADYIRATYNEKPRLFGIPRGGMLVAYHLAHMLKIKEVFTYPASLTPLMRNFIKTTDLVIDDVFDSGRTYAKMRGELDPSVRVISLYSKRVIPERVGGYSQVIVTLDLPPEVFVKFSWNQFEDDYDEHIAETER